jgi:2-dehydropantoate 2-reductase
MHHGILGATGISDHDLMRNPSTRRLAVRCAAEAIAVAQALGHPLEPILRMPPALWLSAAEGDDAACNELDAGWERWMQRSREPHYGSIGLDLDKGRRTEIDHVCGYVVAKGAVLGVETPMQRALLALVKRVERGELARRMENVAPLIAAL